MTLAARGIRILARRVDLGKEQLAVIGFRDLRIGTARQRHDEMLHGPLPFESSSGKPRSSAIKMSMQMEPARQPVTKPSIQCPFIIDIMVFR